MTVPAGLAVDSNGEIYCANAGFFGGGTNAVFQIDPFQLQEVGVASISSAVGLTVTLQTASWRPITRATRWSASPSLAAGSADQQRGLS